MNPAAASTTLRVDTGLKLPGEQRLKAAVEIHWPADDIRPLALFCLPGGGMNRTFFNLGGTAVASYSLARQMAARGFVSILIDPPGIGESDKPADCYALTPARLAQALARVTADLTKRLRSGTIHPELPALPDVRSIGLGHSMGALLTVFQQAQHRQHAGLVLLGFSTDGLPAYLWPEVSALAGDPASIRPRLAEFAQTMFGGAQYPVVGTNPQEGDFYGGKTAEAEAVTALKAARDKLLPVPAFMSILPGNVAPEAAAVQVPVYMAMGDCDLVQPPEDPQSMFPASSSVALQMLEETGHSPFLFASRVALFDELAAWMASLG